MGGMILRYLDRWVESPKLLFFLVILGAGLICLQIFAGFDPTLKIDKNYLNILNWLIFGYWISLCGIAISLLRESFEWIVIIGKCITAITQTENSIRSLQDGEKDILRDAVIMDDRYIKIRRGDKRENYAFLLYQKQFLMLRPSNAVYQEYEISMDMFYILRKKIALLGSSEEVIQEYKRYKNEEYQYNKNPEKKIARYPDGQPVMVDIPYINSESYKSKTSK